MTPASLKERLALLSEDESLQEPEQFCRRADALDKLDSLLAEPDTPPQWTERATRLRDDFEAVNAALYNSIREDVQSGTAPANLLQQILQLAGEDAIANPAPGLSFDPLDDLLSGILQMEEPQASPAPLEPEMVFYQPTPARHLLRLISSGTIKPDDVFIDIGSGLGHVPLLVTILTGARSIGFELEPIYTAMAQQCARDLRLHNATFVQTDARNADLSQGTFFYLYTPFTGALLADVLERIHQQAVQRPIRIAALGPCTAALAEQPWLTAATPPECGRITVFASQN
jgi:hypothetical protein